MRSCYHTIKLKDRDGGVFNRIYVVVDHSQIWCDDMMIGITRAYSSFSHCEHIFIISSTLLMCDVLKDNRVEEFPKVENYLSFLYINTHKR